MSVIENEAPSEAPVGSLTIVYMGPIAPHWEIHIDKGDQNELEEFKSRALARLTLLPPHDPQFRRNKERIVRDAERQNVILDWDLGFDEAELEDRDRPQD